MVDSELVEKIIFRGTALVGKDNIDKIISNLGIKFSHSGSIILPKSPEEVLKDLIESLVKNGGVIAKITLKNMSKQYGFEFPK